MYALASAPTRGTYTITLSAGMVSLPLSLYTSTQSTRVARKEFFNGDTNVELGRAVIRKDTGEVVHQSDVTRMAQATDGTYVTVTDDEMADATSKGQAEVVSFVKVADFGNYSVENFYQARPKREKNKPNPAIEKAFAMVLAGLKARKVGALVKVAMRGPARYAILTQEGDFLLVRTADAIRQTLPLDTPSLTKAEVAMATALIDAIGIDAPVITDDTAEAIQAYVDLKAKGVTPAKTTPVAASDNMMAAFEASIEAAKVKKGKVA
jgi:non-homologous end joining protein Ku